MRVSRKRVKPLSIDQITSLANADATSKERGIEHTTDSFQQIFHVKNENTLIVKEINSKF